MGCDKYAICKSFLRGASCKVNMNTSYKECNVYNEQPEPNPYWENICAIADKQRKKGIETYGQGLEDNTWDIEKRIQYLEEELVDALMYCEWIKEGIKNGTIKGSAES